MQETILKENSIVDESYSLDSFLDKDINLMDPLLKFDPSPLTVNLTMNLCKLHYLFINLGVSTIFVIEDGVLQGIIKKTHFLELNTQVRKSLGKL